MMTKTLQDHMEGIICPVCLDNKMVDWLKKYEEDNSHYSFYDTFNGEMAALNALSPIEDIHNDLFSFIICKTCEDFKPSFSVKIVNGELILIDRSVKFSHEGISYSIEQHFYQPSCWIARYKDDGFEKEIVMLDESFDIFKFFRSPNIGRKVKNIFVMR